MYIVNWKTGLPDDGCIRFQLCRNGSFEFNVPGRKSRPDIGWYDKCQVLECVREFTRELRTLKLDELDDAQLYQISETAESVA